MSNEVERRIEIAQTLIQLRAEVQRCVEKVDENKEATEKLVKLLHENGLITQVALNKQSLSRLWKWMGTISAFILGLAGWILRGSLT